MGLWRPAGRGRQVADFHLPLAKLRGLPEAAAEVRARHSGGLIYLVSDNLKTHKSALVREWLEGYPRIEHAFILKGAAWLHPIEMWWRLFRIKALAGHVFADGYEIDKATRVATRQLNRKAGR